MTARQSTAKGYVGWINKRRVLVGNRALMQEYGIKLPSLEYEQHHTVNQRRDLPGGLRQTVCDVPGGLPA